MMSLQIVSDGLHGRHVNLLPGYKIIIFFFKDQITTVAPSLVGPREVLGHLLAENMALDNFELYKNPKTGGRRINID